MSKEKKPVLTAFSPAEQYEQAVKIIRTYLGVELSMNAFAGDEFAFHDLFLKKHPEECEGISYPDWFHWWSPVYQEDLVKVEKSIYTLYNGNTLRANELEAVTSISPIFNPAVDDKLFRTLIKVVKRYLNLKTRNNNNRGICIVPEENDPFYECFINSTELPKAYLPPKSWFNEKLQALEIGDVLTYLPSAEQKLFALTIGRAVVGANNTTHAMTERKISHSWRTACVTTGTPGVGKSTVCQSIGEALELVGYNVAAFSTLKKQFGISDIICADWAYADDLNDQTFKDLIESGIIKQIVTGGKIRTEKKFLDEVESSPRAAICCNINEFDINLTYNADAGILDRLKILKCYPSFKVRRPDNVTKLSEDSPDLHPIPHIKWLCEKLECSKDALFIRFARLCADYFLKLEAEEIINESVNSLSLDLGIQLHLHFDKVIVMLFQLSFMLRRNKITGFQGVLPEIKPAILSLSISAAQMVIMEVKLNNCRELIKEDWVEQGKPQFHPWNGVKLLEPISLDAAMHEFQLMNVSDSLSSLEKTIKLIYSKLRLTQGYNVAPNIGQVIRAWDDGREHYTTLLDLANRIRNNCTSEEIDLLDSDTATSTCDTFKNPHIDREEYINQWRKNEKFENQSLPASNEI